MTRGETARAVLALAMTVSLIAGAGGSAAASRPDNSTSSCSTSVTHDAFQFDNETISKAANGSASSTKLNTEATVEKATGFVRVSGSNPNGYCVTVHVRISEQVISPAELGEIEAVDSNTTASWHAIRDFENETTYTEVVFTLGSGEAATFAPSDARVKSLSWTGAVKSKGSSLWQNITDIDLLDDEDLEKRSYTFSPENNSTTIITVSLKNDSDGRTVKEWQALSRTEDRGWKPISKDSQSPVFYRMVDEHRIQFIFNDASAEVKFTANPDWGDKTDYQIKSYLSGVGSLKDIVDLSNVFWTTAPPIGGTS